MVTRAKIFIFDDDTDHVTTIRETLEGAPHDHKVVGVAENAVDAIRGLMTLRRRHVEIDTILVDRSAPKRKGTRPVEIGHDVARRARRIMGDRPWIIAYTTADEKVARYGDRYYNPRLKRTDDLGRFITNLPARTKK